ncbi:MAG: response regulator [Myxococcota bacterium]
MERRDLSRKASPSRSSAPLDIVLPPGVVDRIEIAMMLASLAGVVRLVFSSLAEPRAWPFSIAWTFAAAAIVARVGHARRHALIDRRRQLLAPAVWVLGIISLFAVGPKLGVGAALLAAAFLTAFSHGARGVAASMLAVTVLMTLAGWLYLRGWWNPPLAANLGDAGEKQWRILIATAVIVTACAVVGAQLFEHVQTLVDERTRAVNAKEREARIRGEVAASLKQVREHEALGRLAGGVAHDINNGLAVVLVNARLLEQEASRSETLRRLGEEMTDAGARAADAAKALLALGRSRQSAVEEADVATVIDHTLDFANRALPVPVRFSQRVDGSVALAEGRLQHAILRVLVDGLDAATGTEPIIGRADADDETIELSFTRRRAPREDPPSRARRLEPLRAALERKSGRLTCDDDVTSTTFRLSLPRAEGNHRSAPVASPPQTNAPLRPRRILVVDDERSVRRALARILCSRGYEVLQAQDGASAVALFEGTDIDLLISDVVMPNTDTSAMIRSFRARHPGAAVIVCSGFVGQEEMRRAIGAGEFTFIAKPFQPQELLELVARTVARPASP